MRAQTRRIGLLGTASCLSIIATSVLAQEQDPTLEQDDGYLGTLELGESKREIQTDTAVPITNIDQEEIYDRQAGTVAELIDTVPGVTLVNGSTPQGSGINIRGFGANSTFGTDQKVLIQIDGATTGSEEIYRIGTQLFTDPALYKSVSVIRGTVGSFEFGSGVVGGAVLLETNDASDFTGGEPGFRLRQTLEGSSNGNGFTSSSILAWQPTEQYEFLLNYSYRTQDNPDNGNGDVIANSEFSNPSYLAKAKYSFGDSLEHSLTASWQDTTSDDRDVPYDTFNTATFGNVDRRYETKVGILRYQYRPADNDLIDLDVNLSYSDQEIFSEAVNGPDPLLDADHRFQTTKLTVKNTAFFRTGIVDHDLRAGVEYIHRDRLDADSAPGGTDRRFAIFAVDDMRIGDHWTITPALRYETQTIDGDPNQPAPENGTFDHDALMGGLSVRYEFDNGFAIFGSGAYTENLPIIDDLEEPGRINQSEKSRTYEAGFSYNKGDVFSSGDVLRFKVNLYDTELTDITSYVTTEFIPPFTLVFTPLERVETQGAEIEASYAHANGIYADFNANIVHATQTADDGTIERWGNEPADTARLTVGKRFGETLDVSWELVGSRAGFDGNNDPIGGFGVSNLRAGYFPQEGVLQGFEVRFGIENVFDKQYRGSLSTRDAVGRNFKLSVAKTF
ncbi:TonB-dependent receptor [Ruegeria sp.]|uniref:TonB-dependent receptor domain-containing protein n=1 Tax=Ruegeria sp. TaxID=1879320 RepID=UPI0023146914|nr:TonB-dependent receptor [Ruegeria sp.]MDA7965255.1 TonB-dependent receptor [Ruegeria sp.]